MIQLTLPTFPTLADRIKPRMLPAHVKTLAHIKKRRSEGISRETCLGNIVRVIIREIPLQLTKDQMVQAAAELLDN